jgi:hypothetical protein
MTLEEIKNSPDLDLKVRELGLVVGRTLVGGNGVEVKITEVTPHLDIFKGKIGEKQLSFSLRAIAYNLCNGKGSIK